MENHRNWSLPALKLPRRDYGADEIQSAATGDYSIVTGTLPLPFTVAVP